MDRSIEKTTTTTTTENQIMAESGIDCCEICISDMK